MCKLGNTNQNVTESVGMTNFQGTTQLAIALYDTS